MLLKVTEGSVRLPVQKTVLVTLSNIPQPQVTFIKTEGKNEDLVCYA
jgi:hypothetical protein